MGPWVRLVVSATPFEHHARFRIRLLEGGHDRDRAADTYRNHIAAVRPRQRFDEDPGRRPGRVYLEWAARGAGCDRHLRPPRDSRLRVRSLDLDQANAVYARVAEEIGDGVGRTPHLCGVEIRSRNRWDPNQLLELFARSGEVGVDGGREIIMHGLGRLAPGGLMLEWGSL